VLVPYLCPSLRRFLDPIHHIYKSKVSLICPLVLPGKRDKYY
jgi:hypothetical protein